MISGINTIQVVFVVETNPFVRSDNAYIVWLLKKSFEQYIVPEKCSELLILYDFVYMDGKQNYCKRNVKNDIKDKKDSFPNGNTYIVYCIDIDTKGKDDLLLIKDIFEFTKTNGYFLIVSYKEIEDVVKAPSGNSKHERVKRFLNNYPKKESVDERCLLIPFDVIAGQIGKTNFNLVINEIIAKEKNKKK